MALQSKGLLLCPYGLLRQRSRAIDSEATLVGKAVPRAKGKKQGTAKGVFALHCLANCSAHKREPQEPQIYSILIKPYFGIIY